MASLAAGTLLRWHAHLSVHNRVVERTGEARLFLRHGHIYRRRRIPRCHHEVYRAAGALLRPAKIHHGLRNETRELAKIPAERVRPAVGQVRVDQQMDVAARRSPAACAVGFTTVHTTHWLAAIVSLGTLKRIWLVMSDGLVWRAAGGGDTNDVSGAVDRRADGEVSLPSAWDDGGLAGARCEERRHR